MSWSRESLQEATWLNTWAKPQPETLAIAWAFLIHIRRTIIVGHDDLFEAATGFYPDPQGMAYVVKPDGKGSFELIANMLPEEWAKLE
ncbi:hypothetical protein [Nodularia chucula]|uniref:hypothetical protein n=1 Tax=Nodularia chucula TaxID=3093667 RepID=UPI0039C6E5D3